MLRGLNPKGCESFFLSKMFQGPFPFISMKIIIHFRKKKTTYSQKLIFFGVEGDFDLLITLCGKTESDNVETLRCPLTPWRFMIFRESYSICYSLDIPTVLLEHYFKLPIYSEDQTSIFYQKTVYKPFL